MTKNMGKFVASAVFVFMVSASFFGNRKGRVIKERVLV